MSQFNEEFHFNMKVSQNLIPFKVNVNTFEGKPQLSSTEPHVLFYMSPIVQTIIYHLTNHHLSDRVFDRSDIHF